MRPVGLSVAAIGVEESELVPLGLGGAGELLPPADYARAGWYADGPVPGDPGPAVLAGHVDSKAGPAVFFRLGDLRPGDRIVVRRSDGADAVFAVDTVQRHPKDAFPTGAVYGPVPGAALRLITCGGSFDRRRSSYRDNVVVFASALPG
ncbi:class F sortase [Actinokineospora sp. NBRC 105648]|uniref:class F sortase n=1 Tax=Actinokineospora sp. NBRC 105648 TaxID=3032206 RepID=UPI00255282C6|nr:class F sortase [Actinokineospora sp. NBRC 105648]